MHGGEQSWVEISKLADVGCGAGAQAGVLEQILRSHRRINDVAFCYRWSVANTCEEIAAKQRTRRLLEHYTCVPTMRHVRCVDVADAFATDVDHFLVGKDTRRAIGHVSNR